MKKAVGEFSVIGEQKQAFGVKIESADGKNPHSEIGQKIEHRQASLRIRRRGDTPAGFIQGDENLPPRETDRPAVEANAVFAGIDAAAKFGLLAVHFHPALPDQFFGGAPGTNPGLREKLLKPHHTLKPHRGNQCPCGTPRTMEPRTLRNKSKRRAESLPVPN